MAGETVVFDMEILVGKMEEKVMLFQNQINSERCSIYRVIPSLRRGNEAAYEPEIISIGPYHRNKEQLLGMEDVKWQFLANLLNRHQDNKLDKWVKAVCDKEPQARKVYSEELEELEPEAFVQMLVLDGCFIIELLIQLVLEQMNQEQWKVNRIKNDLLLLENQIPFFILQALWDSTVVPSLPEFIFLDNNRQIPMTLLVLAFVYVTNSIVESFPESLNRVQIHHLLHLLHKSLTPTVEPSNPKPKYSCVKLVSRCIRFISHVFIWFLSFCICCYRRSQSLPVHNNSLQAPAVIPCATKLQEAGIRFKRREAKSFLDVKFEEGLMEIPRLDLMDRTIIEFRNLIAFEQCCSDSENHFTSYAALMDYLIDTQMDVALLQDCGIIHNMLGSHSDAALFFNQLCKNAFLDFEKHYLGQVFKDVTTYYDSDIHRWRAKLVHDYFSNPWAIISVFAAILLLGLTIVQTVFAIISYVHPHN